VLAVFAYRREISYHQEVAVAISVAPRVATSTQPEETKWRSSTLKQMKISMWPMQSSASLAPRQSIAEIVA